MKVVTLDQGSEEWLKWRTTGIGASESASAAGLNRWESPRETWRKKMGLSPAFKGNADTRRGQALEPAVRSIYNGLYGSDMEPCCVIHDELDWLKASLDGLNSRRDRIIEIKCPKAKGHALHLGGEIEDYYQVQVQHQLMVTGLSRCDFLSYNPSDFPPAEAFHRIVVKADRDFQEELLHRLKEFWKCIQENTEPTWTNEDTK